jgi:hypothetical protein
MVHIGSQQIEEAVNKIIEFKKKFKPAMISSIPDQSLRDLENYQNNLFTSLLCGTFDRGKYDNFIKNFKLKEQNGEDTSGEYYN